MSFISSEKYSHITLLNNQNDSKKTLKGEIKSRTNRHLLEIKGHLVRRGEEAVAE
jgi:hypothetical protein